MKVRAYFHGIIICLILASAIQSQNQEPYRIEIDWARRFKIFDGPFLYGRLDRYSKGDLAAFEHKVESIFVSKQRDPWDGVYSDDLTELGISELRLNNDIGFVNLYIYTCYPELRSLQYGKVRREPDTIEFIPEKSPDSPSRDIPRKYVKVKWGTRQYLVEQSSLAAFAEKAAGIYVEPENSNSEGPNWANYWFKPFTDEMPKGLPQFPSAYKRFQRLPIEATILSVVKRTVETDNELTDGTSTSHFAEAAWYSVLINAGSDKGIKKTMKFDVLGTGEEVIITEVDKTTSTGLIIRQVDDRKLDLCTDNNGKSVSCPKIRSRQQLRTQIGQFHW